VALKRQLAKSGFLDKSSRSSVSESWRLSASERGAFTMKPRWHFGDYHRFQTRKIESFGLRFGNKQFTKEGKFKNLKMSIVKNVHKQIKAQNSNLFTLEMGV
jgi:hypothetical protein